MNRLFSNFTSTRLVHFKQLKQSISLSAKIENTH